MRRRMVSRMAREASYCLRFSSNAIGSIWRVRGELREREHGVGRIDIPPGGGRVDRHTCIVESPLEGETDGRGKREGRLEGTGERVGLMLPGRRAYPYSHLEPSYRLDPLLDESSDATITP